MIGLACTFSTVLKFYVLCIRKSMPEINESRLAKYAISSIIAVSLSFNYVKFSGNTKPTHNQVSFIRKQLTEVSCNVELLTLLLDNLYGLL